VARGATGFSVHNSSGGKSIGSERFGFLHTIRSWFLRLRREESGQVLNIDQRKPQA
jgi:hypothetical protein